MKLLPSSAIVQLAIGIFSLRVAANSGYAASCTDIMLWYPNKNDPHWGIWARCQVASGNGWVINTIHIKSCFANYNGRLAPALNGDFAASCNDISLHGTILAASCGDGAGGWISTSIDTNEYIGNSDGIMVCFDQSG